MSINYNNKQFKIAATSGNSTLSTATIFTYQQDGNFITCRFKSEKVIDGHLLGIVDENGRIEMSYHLITDQLQLKTGKCISSPSVNKYGKITLQEEWEWTSHDQSKGFSVLEEV